MTSCEEVEQRRNVVLTPATLSLVVVSVSDVVIFASSSAKFLHVVNLVSKLAATYGLRPSPDKRKQSPQTCGSRDRHLLGFGGSYHLGSCPDIGKRDSWLAKDLANARIILHDYLEQMAKFRRAVATISISEAHMGATKPLEPTLNRELGGASLTLNSINILTCLRFRPTTLELIEEIW
ncbi:hypothetical protein RB195_013257 [Necator americanus]|uniref:Uncharacterized protein n=1 Tax=Necator americanus TaxID=51031 RepID=A0ABR1DUQ1_NECAM